MRGEIRGEGGQPAEQQQQRAEQQQSSHKHPTRRDRLTDLRNVAQQAHKAAEDEVELVWRLDARHEPSKYVEALAVHVVWLHVGQWVGRGVGAQTRGHKGVAVV